MSEKKANHTTDTAMDEGQSTLKKAIIIFAIIEALILLPVTLYLILR